MLISVPLGLWAFQLPLAPLPSGRPSPVRAGGGVWRCRLGAPPHHPRPIPSPGQTPGSFHSSPPLPPPRLPSSKSFHPRQLLEEADALLRGRGRSGGRTRGTGGWTPAGGWTARTLPRSPAPGLPGSPAPLCSRPPPPPPRLAGARRRHRGGWPQPQPCPSPPSPPPHHVGVRILHPPRPDFPLPLFWKRERWREATRLRTRGWPSRPACKVVL